LGPIRTPTTGKNGGQSRSLATGMSDSRVSIAKPRDRNVRII